MFEKKSSISDIVGQPLSGVAFVQDYVEFHFDGKIVRALSNPSVSCGRKTLIFPEAGSRDALCSKIGYLVEDVLIKESIEIKILFSGESFVRISIQKGKDSLPESAHYVANYGSPIEIW